MSGPFVPPGAPLTNHADTDVAGRPVEDWARGRSAASGTKRYTLDVGLSETMELNRCNRAHGALRWVGAISITCMILSGCGGSAAGSEPRNATLEPWAGALRALFDDSIHPAAVGLSLDGEPPQDDSLLSARARAAEVVARMRVTTVTADSIGAKQTYYLTLQVGKPPLLPTELPDPSFELVVRSGSPAFGIVSSLDTGLRGRTFIGFVRRFAGDSEPEIHWHLTADAAEVALAISDTSALDEAGQP